MDQELAKAVIDPKSFRCGYGFNEQEFSRGQAGGHGVTMGKFLQDRRFKV